LPICAQGVLVNYWTTWCAPCRKEMPTFDAFHRHYRDQRLEIVGISIDFEHDMKKVHKAAGAPSYPVAVLAGITEDGFGRPPRRSSRQRNNIVVAQTEILPISSAG
jgi:thiol-disulfide isomerase/thioredoxin